MYDFAYHKPSSLAEAAKLLADPEKNLLIVMKVLALPYREGLVMREIWLGLLARSPANRLLPFPDLLVIQYSFHSKHTQRFYS